MDTERRERQKSIRAARDWLSGAADALAGEDDLAGDLKVMLARAELARIAAARRNRLRRWGRFLLPPLAAAAVWAAVSWGSSPPAEHARAVPAAPAAQTEEQHADVRAPASEPMAAVQAPPVPAAPNSAAAETPPPRVQAAEEPQLPAHVRTAAAQPPANEISRMPDRDMQHLMQVGGKILRE